jgi:tRNA pseudouridine13 synthase
VASTSISGEDRLGIEVGAGMVCVRSKYELDHQLGLDYFTTTSTGIGGKLRERIEDFIVDEIPKHTDLAENGEYTHFNLEKENWETISAVRAIARSLGVSYKRFGYAGNKDRRAVTTQRVAAWQVEQEQLMKVQLDGIRLCDFIKSNSRISLGDSEGNRFRITIRNPNVRGRELEDSMTAASEQIAIAGVPNYFGYQRFGTVRPNTHLVGRELVKGNLEAAVMRYLCYPYTTEREECQRARRYLEETRDFGGALRIYPHRLVFERMLLDALSKNPGDFVGALRRLPEKIRTLLVHAYQAYLFNKTLSAMIERGMNTTVRLVPLFGFNSCFSEGPQGELEKTILDDEGVSTNDFLIRPLPEVSCKGDSRASSLNVKPIIKVVSDETVAVEFALPTGSYATTVLREFMKADPLNY